METTVQAAAALRPRVPLGRSGVEVSPIGVGAMTWGTNIYGGASDDDARGAFEASLAGGVDFVDTAEMYGSGRGEQQVGALCAGRDATLATKFMPFPRLASGLPAALDRSLARLGRPTVDLYQIHFSVPWMSIDTLMDRLAEVVKDGRARAVGVSNYTADQLRRAHDRLDRHGIALASNQVQYSLVYRAPELNGVLDVCRERGIALVAYSPLASGVLSGKYVAGARPKDRVRRLLSPLVNGNFSARQDAAIGPLLGALREIAEAHGKTVAQVALRWLVEQPGVIPIPGAKNARQAADNAGTLTFRLDPAEVDRLSEAAAPFRIWRRS